MKVREKRRECKEEKIKIGKKKEQEGESKESPGGKVARLGIVGGNQVHSVHTTEYGGWTTVFVIASSQACIICLSYSILINNRSKCSIDYDLRKISILATLVLGRALPLSHVDHSEMPLK